MIGIFDSGFGGLTILKQLKKDLGNYDYIYLGDNARAPYGNRSQDSIYNYTVEGVDFLFKKGAELIILACNTASTKALKKIQREWLPKNYPDKKVLGVIIPMIEASLEKSNINLKNKKIGVIGTNATINSGVYAKELKKINTGLEIYSRACPLLVPLVEEGWIKRKETKMILKYYLRGLKEKKIDNLILACTHYPLLQKQISQIMGKQIKILDTSKIISEKLSTYLKKHKELEKKMSKKRKIELYTTGNPEKFKKLSQKFWGKKMEKVMKV
ncbi:glutamate racemase [bacterium]|nr:glutamate racemase [bacterium]